MKIDRSSRSREQGTSSWNRPSRKKRRKGWLIPLLAGVLLAAAYFGGRYWMEKNGISFGAPQATTQPANTPGPPPVPAAAPPRSATEDEPARKTATTGSPAAETDLSAERTQTLASLKKLTGYEDGLNVYSMEVFYDYDIDRLTPPAGSYTDQELLGLVLQEALPGVTVDIEAPEFGCTAFTLQGTDGRTYMGRNYDFKFDTSALMCFCHPKNGYSSVCFSAMSNLGFNDPFASEKDLAACLALPLLPLDGMNEKGLAIAVLTLPSAPTEQKNGRSVLATPVLIRMVLDRCATTEEAVGMIAQYDYRATSGRDYHYYITDASGDGRVVEWDCEQPDRPMVVTPLRTITNYFAMHADKVVSGEKNAYGQGKERRDRVEAVIGAAGAVLNKETAWEAAKAASTAPDPQNIISNTQWSVVYDLTGLTHEFTLHRHWEDRLQFGTLAAG